MRIVRCEPEQCALLRQLAITTYEETFAEHNTPENNKAYIDSAFSFEQLEKELATPASVFHLAWDCENPVGFVKTNEAPAQTEFNDKTSLEIERLYVLKSQHGSGLGRQLLETAIDCARKSGKKYVWLGVWEHNYRAQRFYEKNGFHRFSEHVFQLGDDAQTDYLLRKDL